MKAWNYIQKTSSSTEHRYHQANTQDQDALGWKRL